MDTKKSGVIVGGGGGWVEVEEGIVGMNDGKNKKIKKKHFQKNTRRIGLIIY